MVFWETSTHDVRKNSIEDDFAFDFSSDFSESDHRFDLYKINKKNGSFVYRKLFIFMVRNDLSYLFFQRQK